MGLQTEPMSTLVGEFRHLRPRFGFRSVTAELVDSSPGLWNDTCLTTLSLKT
jgi:hypothetical protein